MNKKLRKTAIKDLKQLLWSQVAWKAATVAEHSAPG